MGHDFDNIYASDVLPELARQRSAGVSTQKIVGALIAIEVVLMLCSLGVVSWIMLSNFSVA
jgi:hypothetical protein